MSDRILDYLAAEKWPRGLQQVFLSNLNKIPRRYFICDDSGSMDSEDGHLLSDRKDRLIACSRWQEMAKALKFHAGAANVANATTEFRFLNNERYYTVAGGTGSIAEYEALTQLLDRNKCPGGSTPLCKTIRGVIVDVTARAEELRANKQLAAVVIFTDGESSDGDMAQAMKPFEKLPVWVVVRLCTDQDSIVDYWNNIDQQLELDMDVLDDLSGEASEVYEANSWLTYGQPLHQLREFGIPVKEFDLIDEAKLTADQIWKFCAMIFGGVTEDMPHPDIDWEGFKQSLEQKNIQAGTIWSPKHKQEKFWIRPKRLASFLHKSGGCVMS